VSLFQIFFSFSETVDPAVTCQPVEESRDDVTPDRTTAADTASRKLSNEVSYVLC
jgi:hypothetical protein